MDIYASWLPANLYYLVHLVLWMGPIAILQWMVFPKILRPRAKGIFATAGIVGSYLILTDIVAVSLGIWFFNEALILRGYFAEGEAPLLRFLAAPFGVPIEEWLFFYLTALLVAQSFVLFLPEEQRGAPTMP